MATTAGNSLRLQLLSGAGLIRASAASKRQEASILGRVARLRAERREAAERA